MVLKLFKTLLYKKDSIVSNFNNRLFCFTYFLQFYIKDFLTKNVKNSNALKKFLKIIGHLKTSHLVICVN